MSFVDPAFIHFITNSSVWGIRDYLIKLQQQGSIKMKYCKTEYPAFL